VWEPRGDTGREASGEGDLDAVEDVELIFTRLGPAGGRVSAAALGHLRTLTLIRNGLAEPPRLGSCSRTLTRLCLVHQGLTDTAGLGELPALEELVLSANRLEHFGGLPGCRALRRLWLDRNRLTRLENLESVGGLQELHVGGNVGVRTLAGLVGLVNLRVLTAAGTGIAKLRELEALMLLPALSTVAFRDPHYEDAPVAAAEDYRQRAVHALPQVAEIDGTRVEARERREVQDTYLQSMLRFNDTVQQLRTQEAAHLQALSSQQRDLDDGAREAAADLGAKLERVEVVVRQGRDRVLQAYRALQATQADAKRQLQLKVEGLLAQHSALVDRLLEDQRAEARSLEEEHAQLERLEEFRTADALRLLRLPALSGGERTAYEVAPGSPEMAFVERDFHRAARGRDAGPAGPGAEYDLVGVYRLCDADQTADFQGELQWLAAERQQQADGGVKLRWMYLVHGLDELHVLLQRGFRVEEPSFGRAPLVFASSPQQACGLAEAQVPGFSGLHALLLCQVLQRSEGSGGGGGGVYRLAQADSFLPHFYLHVATRPLTGLPRGTASTAARPPSFQELQEELISSVVSADGRLGAAEADVAGAGQQLRALEAETEAALDHFERSLWHTHDPQMAATAQRQEAELARLRRHLESVNAEIQKQQELQQYIIGEFRSNSDTAAEGPAETPRSRTALLERLRGARGDAADASVVARQGAFQ